MNYLIDKILRGTHRLYVDHYGQYLKPLDRISDPLRTNLLSFGGTMLESKICKIMQAFSH